MRGVRPLGVTCGDVGGIGLECFLKAWPERPTGVSAILYAHPDHVRWVSAQLEPEPRAIGMAVAAGETANDLSINPLHGDCLPEPVAGVWNPDWKSVALDSLERAVADGLAGNVSGVLTLPITKRIVQGNGLDFPGQTEFFAARCGVADFAMMLASPSMRVIPVTTHIPLGEVVGHLSIPRIERIIRLTHRHLVEREGIQSPRIALCGLNPHAGEDGRMGREEIELIHPAMERCADLSGVRLGPYAADTLFPMIGRVAPDAILCMYHDQGLIPFKTLYFDQGVNMTLGLPFPRVSPDHGVAYPIAGKNEAHHSSTLEALRVGNRVARSLGFRP